MFVVSLELYTTITLKYRRKGKITSPPPPPSCVRVAFNVLFLFCYVASCCQHLSPIVSAYFFSFFPFRSLALSLSFSVRACACLSKCISVCVFKNDQKRFENEEKEMMMMKNINDECAHVHVLRRLD